MIKMKKWIKRFLRVSEALWTGKSSTFSGVFKYLALGLRACIIESEMILMLRTLQHFCLLWTALRPTAQDTTA
jgi:hypothetical protein